MSSESQAPKSSIGWAGEPVQVRCPKCTRVLVPMGTNPDGIAVVADLGPMRQDGIAAQREVLDGRRSSAPGVVVENQPGMRSVSFEGTVQWQPRAVPGEQLRPDQRGAHTQRRGINVSVSVDGEQVDGLAQPDGYALRRRAKAVRLLTEHPGEGLFTLVCRCGNRKWIAAPVLARLLIEAQEAGEDQLKLA